MPVKKSRAGLFGIAGITVILLLFCAVAITLFVLFTRTEDISGTVSGVSWSRTIAIEELTPVTRDDWRDDIPAGAVIGTCTKKVHHTESRSTGRTREVCGTPYTVDTGSGFGKVVQDCETEDIKEDVDIYADSCQYTIDVWQEIDKKTEHGNDLSPRWPNVSLRGSQREGKRSEDYECIFNTESGQQSYSTNQNTFNQCQIGSRWILKVNTFNIVTDIEPIQ